MSKAALYCFVSFCAFACGDSGLGSPSDLSGAASLDLAQDLSSARDLSIAPDLYSGGFCDGTTLTGTCAPPFLAPLAACFKPTGACTMTPALPSGEYSVCWSTGTKITVSEDMGTGKLTVAATFSGTPCYSEFSIGEYGPETLTPAGSSNSITYDRDTGALTCPDGTMITVGAAYTMCTAFRDIFKGPSFASCTMGTCP